VGCGGWKVEWYKLFKYWDQEVRIKDDKGTSEVTLLPNNHPAPRGLTAQVSISSGSDHIKSKNATDLFSHQKNQK
jgi:hypothetical protein